MWRLEPKQRPIDKQAGLQCYQELLAIHPGKDVRLVMVDVNEWGCVVNEEARVQPLMVPKTSVMDLNIGISLRFTSRGAELVDGIAYHSIRKNPDSGDGCG